MHCYTFRSSGAFQISIHIHLYVSAFKCMAKKVLHYPSLQEARGSHWNCSGKEALTFTRRATSVRDTTHFRRPPGPAPRDKKTNVQKLWNHRIGKWITPVFSTEDPSIAAHSLVAMASPFADTNVPQMSAPQTQINVYAQPPPQAVTQPVVSQSSFAYLFQQLGAQMDAQLARIVALESKVGALES